MATPDVPLLPFDVDADPINIKVWWSWMHSTTHITVARRSYIHTISHCKDTTGVKHEFLVLEAHIRPEHGDVYTICIKVERTVRDRDGPSPRSSSTSINDSVASAADSSDISSSNAKAADLITVLPSDYLLRPSGWEVGRELHLNGGRLSLADIASLISSASTSAELYKLFKQNCYWFSKTIFDVVLQEFKVDDVVVNPNVALGHYHSISPWIPEPGVLNKIVSEWNGKIEIGNNIKSSFEKQTEANAKLDKANAKLDEANAKLDEEKKRGDELAKKLQDLTLLYEAVPQNQWLMDGPLRRSSSVSGTSTGRPPL